MDNTLSDAEAEEALERAFQQEFKNGRRGSISRFAFLQHYYAGEKRLEKQGRLDLFRKSQQFPEYKQAEDSIRRGWECWINAEYGISPQECEDKLKIRQWLILCQLRSTNNQCKRQEILRGSADVCSGSAARGDIGFMRKLGRALGSVPGKQGQAHDFTQVMLWNWLPSFWWLTTLDAVAREITELQGTPENTEKHSERLRKTLTRKSDWIGCFYFAKTPLIDCFQKREPQLNALGKRAFRTPLYQGVTFTK